MREEWRPVPGFEGLYEASSMGRVRSIDRTVINCRGTAMRWRSRLLKQNNSTSGYPQVVLCSGGKPNNTSVHRIIADTFLGGVPEGKEVCHCDGDKTNNRVPNLRIDDRKGNMADCVLHGTSPVGSRNAMAKLSDADVEAIRIAYASGESSADLSARYGVHKGHIASLASGRFRKSAPGPILPSGRNKGSAAGWSKLTEDAVREIRARHANGEGKTAIAEKYGVSRTAIHHVIAGRSWAHV